MWSCLLKAGAGKKISKLSHNSWFFKLPLQADMSPPPKDCILKNGCVLFSIAQILHVTFIPHNHLWANIILSNSLMGNLKLREEAQVLITIRNIVLLTWLAAPAQVVKLPAFFLADGFRPSCWHLKSGGKLHLLPISTLAVQMFKSVEWFGVSNKPATKGENEVKFLNWYKIFLLLFADYRLWLIISEWIKVWIEQVTTALSALPTSWGAKARAHFWNFPFCFYTSSGHCVESEEVVMPGWLGLCPGYLAAPFITITIL